MAESNSTAGVQYQACSCWDTWTGSGDALVKAGVVEKHQLPGEPGRNKTSVTIGGKRGQSGRGSEYLQIIKKGANKYWVRKGISPDEEKAREKKWDMKAKQYQVDMEIERFKKNAEDFRVGIFAVAMAFEKYVTLGSGGYGFSNNDHIRLVSHIETIKGIMATGKIDFSDQRKRRQLEEIYERLELAIPDSEERHLKLVTSPAVPSIRA